MPHPSRRPPLQLNLFEEAAPPLPHLTVLPKETRTVLTQLVTRMLIAHARGEALGQEGDDDRA